MATAAEHPKPWVPRNTFGNRLAQVRAELGGWNVARAARYCELDDQSWRNWEAGKRCHDLEKVAKQIADKTGCDFYWLLAGREAQHSVKLTRPDLRVHDGGGRTTMDRSLLHLIHSE